MEEGSTIKEPDATQNYCLMDAHVNENTEQSKSCGGGEGDLNLWIARTSENIDKQVSQCHNSQVFKSGPLLISSKGIGWTSWKKRWFILTRTSLVFFRSDPNAVPQRGSEGNLTLGGIDLNNAGSVVVRADKKLLTVLFPDGRDGRAFTLKAETSEDLYEWKSALENALAQAPSAAFTMGHNGIFRSDVAESIECSLEQWKDRRPVKSAVVGRPVLLALEDIDGEPSFLEKALRFIEEHGVKVEGILRQSADVEEVKHRVQEYEHGKIDFSPDEDAHVIGDCIKHVLRELPSSPVPASCCTALVEAYRAERGGRVNAIRTIVSETFPDPNRRLLQRILKMMRTVASHKAENRMTLSALAACMAPLLLRPLLAGDCELEDDFGMGGDGSIQLLQAAAAANHAQAIVIILLEEYARIFVPMQSDYIQEGSFSTELCTESEADDGDGDDDDDDDDDVDDETTDDEIQEDDGYHDAHNDLGPDTEDDPEYSSSEALDESSSVSGSHIHDNKDLEVQDSDPGTPKIIDDNEANQNHSDTIQAPLVQQHTRQTLKFTTNTSLSQQDGIPKSNNFQSEANYSSATCTSECCDSLGGVPTYAQMTKSVSHILPSSVSKLTDKSDAPVSTTKRRAIWGRTSARKNLSMESIDYTSEDETAIQRLEITKSDLQSKIAKEVKENEILQASLERRKEDLHERRVALQQDVERLKVQLQKERDLRACLEAGVMNLEPGHFPIISSMDGKTRADLEEIALAEADVNNLKQKVAELHGQLNQQRQQSEGSLCKLCCEHQFKDRQPTQKDPQKDVDTKPTRQKSEKSYRNEKSGGTCENMKSQTQGLSSRQNMQLPDKQQDKSTHPNRSYSPRFSSSSSTEANAAFMKSFESVKTQSWGLSLHNKQPSQRQQSELASQNSTNSTASVSSSNEEPSSIEPDAPPMKSNNGENVLFGTSNNDVETQNQELASSPINEPPQMQQQTSVANMNSSKFSSSSTNLSTDESTTGGRNASSKKSSARSEEAISSSSSALARLTNRLNFLKERRYQLVNEFQNIGTGYTQGSEGPPRNASR